MEFGHNQSAPDEKVTNIIGESKDVDDEDGSKRTEYLSANCVLVTYFSGKDAAKVVDEHFNRALHKEEEEETADEKHPLHAPPTGGKIFLFVNRLYISQRMLRLYGKLNSEFAL